MPDTAPDPATPVWRGMDQVTLDREYNARATVPDFAAELRRYRDTSAQARATLRHTPDLVYEPASGCALDWFTGAPGGPVVLWVHGGYWRALSKEDQSCVAPGLVAAGAHVAVMDHRLAPAVTLDTILNQVQAAAAWVHAHAPAHGADPARVFAAGHSAGGHLCGLLTGDSARTPLAGAIGLSGLYDLEPIRLSHINAWLGLDAAAARRLSPLHTIPHGRPAPPLLVAYGGRETGEFQRQSEQYAAAWQDAGHRTTLAPQPSRHHFDIVLGLGEADDPLCRAACRFLQGP